MLLSVHAESFLFSCKPLSAFVTRLQGIVPQAFAVFAATIKENHTKRVVLFDFPKTERQAELLEKAFWQYKVPEIAQPGSLKRFSYTIPSISDNQSLLLPSVTMHTKIPPHRSAIMKVYCADPSIYESMLVKKEMGKLPFSFFDKSFHEKFNLANYKQLTEEMHTFYKGFSDFELWNHTNKMWSNVVSFRKPLKNNLNQIEMSVSEFERQSQYYKENVCFYLSNGEIFVCFV